MKTAACVFIGVQQAPKPMRSLAMFNLIEPIPGHAAKSTVTAKTLAEAGYEVPAEEAAKALEALIRAEDRA